MNPPIMGEMICHASIGTVKDTVVTNKGKTSKRKEASIVLGGDHRVMDGASCARFAKSWK